MSWLNENRNIVRVAILALLIVSLLGPWMFDRIFVPVEYMCSPPNIRLGGDFCGVPVSGFQFFGLFVGGFFQMILELISGTFGNRSRELLVGLSILPLIPFFTSLLLSWKQDPRRLPKINLIAWILALIPTLTIFIIQIKDQIIRLWGLWLYILVAVSAIIFETLLLKRKTDGASPITFDPPV